MAWSPTSCLIETRVSQPQPLLGTLDLAVIMTDEDKTDMESSRPSPLDPATEQAQPRQLTRDNQQEWFSSFQQPAEGLPTCAPILRICSHDLIFGFQISKA